MKVHKNNIVTKSGDIVQRFDTAEQANAALQRWLVRS